MGVLDMFVFLLLSLRTAALRGSEETASLLQGPEFGAHAETVTLYAGGEVEGVMLLSMGARRMAMAQEQQQGHHLLQEEQQVHLQNQSLDACAISSEDVDAAFDQFRTEHGRTYEPGSAEYQQRHALFEQHLQRMQEINCRSRSTWRAGVNKYADRAPAELAHLRGYLRPGGQAQSLVDTGVPSFLQTDLATETDTSATPLPKSIDWRRLPAMAHVKEQGSCGSCWAFAASSALSAHSELYEEASRTFSPQHLVQCVANPRNCGGAGGCEGATVELAMEHALRRGVATAESIPYTGEQPSPPCPADEDVALLRRPGAPENGLTGFRKLPENEAEPILRALQEGPVTASVMAEDTWFDYEGGILDSCARNATVNHAVILAGYGEEVVDGETRKYWLIQNSWGTRWGEGGFLRLQRHDAEEQHCGWDLDPSQGNACEDEPLDKVWVCGSCGILSDVVRPIFKKP